MPYSEERETLFGAKYIQHFDDDGNKIGTSEERESMFGNTYVAHLDKHGDEIGRSEKRTGWLGGDYIQHFDAHGGKSGHSESRETFFGEPYEQHFDREGGTAGRSENRERLLGGKYTQHSADVPDQTPANDIAAGHEEGLFENPMAHWVVIVPWTLVSLGLAYVSSLLSGTLAIILAGIALPGLLAGGLLAFQVGIVIAVWAAIIAGAFYLIKSCVAG